MGYNRYMRSALNNTSISGYVFGESTDQKSGLPDNSGVKRHLGIDLVANVGTPFFAPESGTIINVWGNRQNLAGGNIVELQGAYTHRFLHLYQIGVSAGQQVSEGQALGTTGNSGGVGAHLHHDTRRNGTAWNASFYNYVDWLSMIKSNQGADMADANDVRAIYQYGPLGRAGDDGGVAHYTGKKTDQILVDHANSAEGKAKAQAVADKDTLIANLKTALENEQAKPPKEVIKEVKVIVKEIEYVDKIQKETVYINDPKLQKDVTSIKMMLVNFIGWVKNKLGRK